jgi:FtsH ternary system domain X1
VELGPLLQAVPRPRSGWDHLARYGLIGAVQQATAKLSEYDTDFLISLGSYAPLIGVFGTPGPYDAMACNQLARAILATPEGRATATGLLAEPCPTDAAAAWRGSLLERARLDHPDFVLDVYEKALTIHRNAHATRRLLAERSWRTDGLGPAVVATARWWTALAYLERRQRHRVGARGKLRGEDYLPGVRLHWKIAQATGGAH